jgi:hypothetical protein
MGAVLYHCKTLAQWYANECLRFSQELNKPDGINKVVITPEEPYFEFESLVTGIVRGYDTLRYALWNQWGRNGSCPSSYERTVNALVSCPPQVLTRLQSSRDNYYSKAKEYRHCIQHYVDFGSASWAMMDLLRESVWSVIVRVPDNPEARSSRSFRFNQNVDALTLGWELCTEMFAVIDVALGPGVLSAATNS